MLFVVMLGGRHARANTEVHDVVFASGDTLEATYPQLRRQWFGQPDGLHVDSWLEVDGVEGYRVRLADAAPLAGAPRLYFINLGGYEVGVFGEAHRYRLVVAGDRAEAKRKLQAGKDWDKPHTDALLDVDDCIPIEAVDGRHIVLTQSAHRGIVCRSDYLVLS